MRTAIVVLVAATVVVGLGGYIGLQSARPTNATGSSCAPACGSTVNDVTLFIPYTIDAGHSYAKVAAGTPVSATVGVLGDEPIKSFSVTWAPGQATTGSTGAFSYSYPAPGLFPVYANATTSSGVVHTGTGQLVALQVEPSVASVEAGFYPTVSLTLTNASGGPYPWIAAGGSVTVNGTYSGPPAHTVYSPVPPKLTIPAGSTQSGLRSGSNYASAKYTFESAGYYSITLVAPVTGLSGALYQNYTWGIYVGATAAGLGCPECEESPAASPHPGTLVNYELAPGGPLTLDPAADYYSVGYEVDQSIDETLVTPNGTQTGQTYSSFVPEAATCVPGSPLCVKLYGQTMVKGGNYTFAIDPAAHFYDPSTGASREVYPSDVLYSIIRAIFYTQVETVTGYYAGFDIAGPLVPYAGLSPHDVNASWDLGPGAAPVHYPYNNTPYWTFDAFAVNDTAYCPAAAMAANGCITFHADADGRAWPALLQVLSIISAGGIEASGWYAAQGAEVPGFVCPSNPDSPCLLPGGTTSTNTTAFHTAVAAMSPTGWDSEEIAGLLQYPNPVPAVQWNEVGSGPYYLAYANQSLGYDLKTNPSYEAPTGCAGEAGCLPNVGSYAPSVVTYWNDNDSSGLSEIRAGYADTAAFEPSHYPVMLNLTQNGQLGFREIPTMTTDNFGFNIHVDLDDLAVYDPNPINLPANAFAYEGLRATLEYAYPYATAQAVGNVVDGVSEGAPFGGFLPSSETAFYDAQVPWPNYNTTTETFSNPTTGPSTTPGTAAWYWAEANDCPSGPLCDPELASFSSLNPLVIPVFGVLSAPDINEMEIAWGNSVKNITEGSVVFQQIFAGPAINCLFEPCEPWTIWWFGWLPDYPAPVDNWGAYGTGLWGDADALYPTLSDGVYGGNLNDTILCGHYNPTTANMTYWAEEPNQVIPQDCQGTAFNITAYFVTQATYSSNISLETQDWDLVQAVYNNLQLTIGISQPNAIFTYAPWIDSATINSNALIGGSGEWAWYQLGGNGVT